MSVNDMSETAAPPPSDSPAAQGRYLVTGPSKIWRPVDEDLARVQKTITDILLSQNLIVLCGLGTSLYLKGADDKPIAPTMAVLWEAATALPYFEYVVKTTDYPTGGDGNIVEKDVELLLSRCQLYQYLKTDDKVAGFINQSEKLIVEKCQFVKPELELVHHQNFLLRAARRSTRLPRMKLFTTNYDLCFEAAASKSRFVVVDGFSHTNPQEFDGSHFDYDFVWRRPDRDAPDYIPNVFHLYKIHGSVDWVLMQGESQIRRESAPAKPHLIFPRNTKYQSSYDQPFLEMMSRLQIALRQPNTGLLIVGFGFNDFHITQPLMAALDSNVSIKCLVVDPTAETSQNLSIRRLETLIKAGDSRILVLADTFENFVPMIPDLIARTEDEEHRARVREAGLRS